MLVMRRTTPAEGLPQCWQRPHICSLELLEAGIVPRTVTATVAIMDATQGQRRQGQRQARRSCMALTAIMALAAIMGTVTWTSSSGRRRWRIMASPHLYGKFHSPRSVEPSRKNP